MFRRHNETAHVVDLMLREAGFVRRGSHASYDIWDHWSDGRILLAYDDGSWRVAGTLAEGNGRWTLLSYLSKTPEERSCYLVEGE